MLPINPNRVADLYRNAMQLMQAGKTAEAISVLQNLVAVAPQRAEFEFQIGRIHADQARYEQAARFFALAAGKASGEVAIWQAYADTLAALAHKDVTAKALTALKKSKLDHAAKKAIRTRMTATKVRSQRSGNTVPPEKIKDLQARFDAGEVVEVEADARALMQQHPKKSEVLYLVLGSSLAAQEKFDEADTAFQEALKIDPDYGEAHAYLGQMLVTLEQNDRALEHLIKARRLIPQAPAVLGNLGQLYGKIGRFAESLDLLDTLLEKDPKNQFARFVRANTLQGMRNFEAALAVYETLQGEGYEHPKLPLEMAQALSQVNRLDDALEMIDGVLAHDPDWLPALTGKAAILQGAGRFDDANTVLLRAIEVDPHAGSIYRQFATGKKIELNDPIVAKMETVFDEDDLQPGDRLEIAYALAKAMQDTKQYDKVFRYLRDASDNIRAHYPYDATQLDRETRWIKRFFGNFDAARIGRTGYKDIQPIFVTGLPRSGTTLAEQILSSHSQVSGFGELAVLNDLTTEVLKKYDSNRATIADIKDEDLYELGRAYGAALKKRDPNAIRTTDKSISTYKRAGLAWLALPNSKMVVLTRDPRDNLFSIYKNRFADGTHLYSYSQADLVTLYRNFRETCDFWRQIAPDRFYELSYEDLVANPEAESRKLLEFCGLDWEDACLEFYKTERRVDTLSIFQVRQPMYKSSVAAWRRYEKDLDELLTGLKDLGLSPDD